MDVDRLTAIDMQAERAAEYAEYADTLLGLGA
jgi:hypothetical protein